MTQLYNVKMHRKIITYTLLYVVWQWTQRGPHCVWQNTEFLVFLTEQPRDVLVWFHIRHCKCSCLPICLLFWIVFLSHSGLETGGRKDRCDMFCIELSYCPQFSCLQKCKQWALLQMLSHSKWTKKQKCIRQNYIYLLNINSSKAP